jgi:flagellar FliJ protein
MKAFRFSLQAVHVLREQQERKAMDEYARDLQAANAANERLRAVQLELENVWQQLQSLSTQGATAREILQLHSYSSTVKERKKQCEALLNAARNKAGESCRKYLEARQKRETVDRFREQQKERYDRNLALEEQARMDELALRNRSLADFTGAGPN